MVVTSVLELSTLGPLTAPTPGLIKADNPTPQGCNLANVATQGNITITGSQTNNINCTNLQRSSPSIPPKLHCFPPRTPNFYGREQELTNLKNFVAKCQTYENWYEKMILISGLGGMGKSEIVKVLAEEVKARFDYIFWFNAQSKESLETSFAQLLHLLNAQISKEEQTPFGMASKAYTLLEEHFSKTIFIFDNAESLKSESSSSFEFEKYLLPEFPCKKPVFIVTTRDKWHRLEHESKIQIFCLYELSDDDAKVCFLKYLRIEGLEGNDRESPMKKNDSLSQTIDKLVHIVQGHPLGIFLMGSEAARQENEISFGGVETRISNYLRLLENHPLNSLTGQEKYERNLQIIFEERMRKLEDNEAGRDASKIVSILSLLSPDHIYVGLVNAIFSRKIFYPQGNFCECFLVKDSELQVQKALKLLESNSLIRIEPVKTFGGDFDMIRIHRLVQRSVRIKIESVQNYRGICERFRRLVQRAFRKCNSHLLEPKEAIQLIADFFDFNENNNHFRCHIPLILKIQEKAPFRLENHTVLFFVFKHIQTEKVIISALRDETVAGLLRSREWSAHEKLVVSLIKILTETIKADLGNVQLRELKKSIMGLPKELIRRAWVLELCTNFFRRYHDLYDREDRIRLRCWLKKCYMEAPSINRYFRGLLECIYKINDSNFDSGDKEFVFKAFCNASDRERIYLWREMNYVCKNSDKFMELLSSVFMPSSGGTSLLVESLEFQTNAHKLDFINYWAGDFIDCVSLFMEDKVMREKLLATDDFASTLKDITEFSVNAITPAWDRFVTKGFFHLLKMWLNIFSAHELTYQRFGQFVDRVVMVLLNSGPFGVLKRWLYTFLRSDFLELSLRFTFVEYCSEATKSWLQTLLQIKSDVEDAFLIDPSISDCPHCALTRFTVNAQSLI